MKRRSKSTGYRQKAWDALRDADWDSTQLLAEEVGAAPSSMRGYIGLLEKHGYVGRLPDGALTLLRDTGPRAPSASVHTGELRDWNLEPTLSAEDLERAIAGSQLSIAKWLEANGMHIAGATRVRQMINGQRPVSEELAAIVRSTAK